MSLRAAIEDKKKRNAIVVAKVRKLRTQWRRLRKKYEALGNSLRKLDGKIIELQKLCPHDRKEWWYGDIGEGWKCKDCGVDG